MRRNSAISLLALAVGAVAMSAAPASASDTAQSAQGLVFAGGWVSEWHGNGTVWADLENIGDKTAGSGVVTFSFSHEVSDVHSVNSNADCQLKSDDNQTIECSLVTPIKGHQRTDEYLKVEYTYADDGDDWTETTVTAQVDDGAMAGTTVSEDYYDNGDSWFF